MEKKKDFDSICSELSELYVQKNTRYKDSFSKQFEKKGLSMSVMRIEDKFNRLEALSENPEDDGGDESVIDTLKDLANYSIMTIMALREQQGGDENACS